MLLTLSIAACNDGPAADDGAPSADVGGSQAPCDRDCLIALTKSYLAAIVAGTNANFMQRLQMPRAGLVHEIEAVGFVAPYNSPTGWE